MEKTIKTNRLLLRPFNTSDTKLFWEITRDKRIYKYTNICPLSIKETERYIRFFNSKNDFEDNFYFVIANKKTNEMIGALFAEKNIREIFSMTLMISKEHRKKGYMSEALKAFICYMPKESILEFVVRYDNKPSLKTVKSLPNIKDVSKSYKVQKFKVYNLICNT